ncbi:MAG: chemotaxis response regulator protein-glutamate methylesterase [Steroidobacteraceae bacterium]|nr:chemotaxis response regulator protein-glutamate methylesterase [Nevskiaceae bacterium]MCP5338875.1 chemotaxis response regulator protein-glutamate methylesterase [Nevskiaceae bacterium]MCP5360736.1 chemotaxis response regulator protein-glutamate methylesterase [Nevskiaceae bacterium]MCP5466210.1 chemotaxis response regulator protein-glutamate methylesterase [Nevskiaceae bacterium]MCP5471612.1 chemotaxis response regulator protein-glutamate methylesterase [Nevskiaceae bacterium]
MATGNGRIKVLIVDDSALVRQLLTAILGADPDLEVVGAAQDAYIARDKIKALNPDVITLDVEMPKMNGIQFLRNLMRLRPMPVVMCSSLTEQGAEVTLAALELGAVDFVTKPKIDLAHTLENYAAELIDKIKIAARARVRGLFVGGAAGAGALRAVAGQGSLRYRTTDQLIAIGASTGGTEAIREVLCRLPADAPGIVISQHIPAMFSGPFAARMNASSRMTVHEARDGQLVIPGHVFIAPGDQHLVVERDGARWRVRLTQDAPVNHHRPSVDVMFRSVARCAGPNAIGVMLTGMGADGAKGMLEMREAGAHNVVQDEQTSVVWGMPRAAANLGAAERILPLHEIADQILEWVAERNTSAAARARA